MVRQQHTLKHSIKHSQSTQIDCSGMDENVIITKMFSKSRLSSILDRSFLEHLGDISVEIKKLIYNSLLQL